jgi:hypothetical protein
MVQKESVGVAYRELSSVCARSSVLYNAKCKHMDISEVLSSSKFFLPLVASWIIFRVARRIRARWLQLCVRTVSSALVVVSAAVVLLVSITSVACSRRAHPMYSPDRHHIAILTNVVQGALGDDYANVAFRSRWIPWASNATAGWVRGTSRTICHGPMRCVGATLRTC